MLALPPVAPVIGWRHTVRLPRDHYIRLDGNDYSVHPAVIGRRIEVHADLGRVRAHCDGQLVADHARCWAKHQTITDDEHKAAADRLRLQRSTLMVATPAQTQVERRCLADYDDAFGVDPRLDGGEVA